MVKQCIEAVEQVNRKKKQMEKGSLFVLLFKEEIFSIIIDLRSLVTINLFKKHLKTDLFKKAYNV